MVLQAKVDLDKRTPLGPLRLSNEVHACFVRGAIGLECVARNAGTHDIFPRRRPAPIARHYMVEIQILPFKFLAAILAGVAVALEDIVPGEFDFFFGQPIE